MTLKFSCKSLLLSLFLFLPLSALAQQGDVSVSFDNGGPPTVGQLEDTPNGLYLDTHNGQSYKLAPGQNELAALERQNALLRRQIFQQQQYELQIQRERKARQEAIETEKRNIAIREENARQMDHRDHCHDLLWSCQLPTHQRSVCQSFTNECSDLPQFSLSVPLEKALGGNEQDLYPDGYLQPNGIVKGFYDQILGYVTPDDFQSALIMAETAMIGVHDQLPETFPKSSETHRYKASASEIKTWREKTEPLEKSNYLFDQILREMDSDFEGKLDEAVFQNDRDKVNQAKELLEWYNKTHQDHINIEQSINTYARDLSCVYYRRSRKLPVLEERLHFLEKCGRDPWILNPNRFQGTISDCYTLNRFCQVRMANKYKEENPYCKTFKQGQCLSLKNSEIPNFFNPPVPLFWQTTKSARSTVHTDYASCLIGENAVIEAHGYFLGKITEDGFLTLYLHGKILRNIAQFKPDGKLIKYSSKSPIPEALKPTLDSFERSFLEKNFQHIKPILGNGILRDCGKYNHKNKMEINSALILTPQGEIIKAGYGLYDRALFAFEQADMQNMRQENH
ncbi:hypothetical protein FAI41_03740 [Acetobacteraceae bacterium]|nr:hypothetical protein FAI41_03740 [Acetobacteraceae bacterium]